MSFEESLADFGEVLEQERTAEEAADVGGEDGSGGEAEERAVEGPEDWYTVQR